jgi:hypothetical protein
MRSILRSKLIWGLLIAVSLPWFVYAVGFIPVKTTGTSRLRDVRKEW